MLLTCAMSWKSERTDETLYRSRTWVSAQRCGVCFVESISLHVSLPITKKWENFREGKNYLKTFTEQQDTIEVKVFLVERRSIWPIHLLDWYFQPLRSPLHFERKVRRGALKCEPVLVHCASLEFNNKWNIVCSKSRKLLLKESLDSKLASCPSHSTLLKKKDKALISKRCRKIKGIG